jgi:hypothetical protein
MMLARLMALDSVKERASKMDLLLELELRATGKGLEMALTTGSKMELWLLLSGSVLGLVIQRAYNLVMVKASAKEIQREQELLVTQKDLEMASVKDLMTVVE